MTTAEIMRKEMVAIGEMLSNGLALEHELTQLVTDHPSDENLVERWKESRRTVERLAGEYARAVERYRQWSKPKPGSRPTEIWNGQPDGLVVGKHKSGLATRCRLATWLATCPTG